MIQNGRSHQPCGGLVNINRGEHHSLEHFIKYKQINYKFFYIFSQNFRHKKSSSIEELLFLFAQRLKFGTFTKIERIIEPVVNQAVNLFAKLFRAFEQTNGSILTLHLAKFFQNF